MGNINSVKASLPQKDDKIKGLVSIVVPTYQETENLTALTNRIVDVTSASGETFEIIIVDDDS